MAQAGTVTVSGGGNVTPAKRLIMMGRRYKNALTNGNFTNGFEGWRERSGGIILGVFDGRLKAIVDRRYGLVGPRWSPTINHKYYFSADIEGTTDNYILFNNKSYYLSHTGRQILSGIVTVDSESTYVAFGDRRTSDWTEFFIDNVIIIDLTSEFGAGNEPDLTWCDANIPQNIIW